MSSSVGPVYQSAAGASSEHQLLLLRRLQQEKAASSGAGRLKKPAKTAQPAPIAVAKRNARERNRVKQVNNGFATLRQHIPSHVAQGYASDRGKKLSKVETLRMAVEYIRGLQRLLSEAPKPSRQPLHSRRDPLADEHRQQSIVDVLVEEDDDDDGADDDDDDVDDEDEPVEDAADEPKSKRPTVERLRPASRLSDNRKQKRRCYLGKQASFGDEENIEPPANRNNNNNNSNVQNNNVLACHFSSQGIDDRSCARRELLPPEQEQEASASSHYSAEILIENPETGRLLPLKVEDADEQQGQQLLYLSAELPLADAAELDWWEQQCIVQQMHHQEPEAPAHRPLAPQV